MTVAPPPDIILTDGPFLKNSGPAGRNLSLLGSFLPLTLAGVVIRGPATLWPLGLTLAGAFGGLTLFAARRREALGGLDWAVWAWLAAVTVAFAPPDHEPYAALSQGLILGFIAGRPRCARLAALPGLSVLMSAAVLMAVEAWGGPAWLHVGWRITDWPSVVLLAVSGLCFSPRLKPAWRLAAPWLAFAAVFAAVFSSPYGRDFLSAGCPMAARASSLALPAFFVAPFLARSAIQLGWCAAGTLALLIFFPSPFMTRVSDMPTEILAYLALALFAPLAALPAPGRPASAPAAKKAAPKPAATAGPAAPAFKARLKCGHGGLAPRLSRYRGLESCRIAAEHDGGPLACPYGCLALGDCVRVCPHKAVSLEGRAGASGPAFPVFDPGLCRGCGLCLSACPKNLIVLIPAASRVFVPCAAEEGLKKNAAFCDRSCLGCGRCRKACPAGAVSRPAPVGAMIINQSLCLNYAADCGQACAQSCPRHIFRPPAGRGL